MINSFRGHYSFLSNFYRLKNPIQFDGVSYLTVEHFFQSMKCLDMADRIMVSKAETPSEAKVCGRSIQLRPDWSLVRVLVMRLGLVLKFSVNPLLQAQLLNTKNEQLVEGNMWHDNLWGDCICPKCVEVQGQNLLGKLLMETRSRFQLLIPKRG